MNITKEFKLTIKFIDHKLKENNIIYAIITSTNLALQGIDVKPNDIDIIVNLNDLIKISDIFSDYLISSVKQLQTTTKELAWDVKLKMYDVDVQFIGEQKNGIYLSELIKKNLIFIDVDNIKIPCLTFEAEIRAYKKTNREHKAKMIEDFLK